MEDTDMSRRRFWCEARINCHENKKSKVGSCKGNSAKREAGSEPHGIAALFYVHPFN
jgi:hypothetical protein